MRKQTKFSRTIAAALSLSLCFGSVCVQAAEPATEATASAEAIMEEQEEVVATATDVAEQVTMQTEQGEALDVESDAQTEPAILDEEFATETDAYEEDVTEDRIEAALPTTLTISGAVNIASLPISYNATIFGSSSANPPSTVYMYKPTKSGVITYYSSGSKDPYGAIYDEKGNRLLVNRDDGERYNFKLEYAVEAGKTYYFALAYESGASSSNTTVTVSFKFDEIKEGWNKVDGEWFYWQNGKPVASKGLMINGEYYFFAISGKAYRNTVSYINMPELGYARYGFDESCKMIRDGWFQVHDKWYYFDSNGKGQNGIVTVKGVTYYLTSGEMNTDYICEQDGYAYYFGNDGKLVSKTKLVDGWIKLGTEWAYCQDGKLMEKGWVHDKGWYYIQNSRMLKNKIYMIEDNNGTNRVYHTYAFGNSGLLCTGWIYFNNKWLYAEANGVIVEDAVKEINGATYYFDDDGNMRSNYTLKIGNTFYHFGVEGKMDEKTEIKEGWNKFLGDWYYMKSGILCKSGFVEINGATYYFDSTGVMIANKEYNTSKGKRYFDAKGHMITGWYLDTNAKWYYLDENGQTVSGFYTIGEKTYYFSYYMKTDSVQYKEGTLHYFGAEGYEEETLKLKEGWNKFKDKWYYYRSGSLLKGTTLNADDGYTYYFDSESYYMCTNKYVNVNGTYHYFDEKGHMATGWVKNEFGAYYYFDEKGNPYSGLREVDGKLYHFTSGRMDVSMEYYDSSKEQLVVVDAFGYAKTYKTTANGWVSFYYYLVNGKLTEGWKKIDGYWYYFDSGRKVYNDWREINGNTYMFDNFGRMRTGWFKMENQYNSGSDLNWCYADQNGALTMDGWKKINNKWYYFQKGFTCSGMNEIDGKLYLFDDQGTYVKEISAKFGWVKEGNKYYYIDSNGLVRNKTKIIDNETYSFDSKGVMHANEMSFGYYFGADGKAVRDQWVKVGPVWLYFGADGEMLYNEWLYKNNKWYYFDDTCRMVTGTYVIGGKAYYFDKDGAWTKKTETANGWKLIEGVYYYYIDGKPVNGLCTIDGVKYYFRNQNMVHNELVADGVRYLVFGNDGKLAKNAWVKMDGQNYVYADATGHAVDGYQTINGKNYYFSKCIMANSDCVADDYKTLYQIEASGAITKKITASGTGWVKTANGNYAYSFNGKFLNGYQVIAKKPYYFEYGILVMNDYVEDYGYFGKSGALEAAQGWGETKDGWIYLINGISYAGAATINGKDYYFGSYDNFEYGEPLVGLNGLVSEQGELYDYNFADGTRKLLSFKEGWSSYNGQWVYVKNGNYLNDVHEINGEYYWFEGGILQTNRPYSYYYDSIEGFFGADGKLLKSQWVVYEGDYYYVDEVGLVVSGIYNINGVKYVFTSDGRYIGRL